MKKNLILVLLFFPTIVQAQTQIDSIQFIGNIADSLVFVVHSTISGGADDYSVEYIEEGSTVKVNMLYTQIKQTDCYCPFQDTIKIKKIIYTKAIVEVKVCFGQDCWLVGIKEIDLSNIASIDDSLISSKIVIFPNPVQNVLYIGLRENKAVNLEIYSTQGNLLLSKNMASDKVIDVSFLTSGLYFVFVDRKYFSKIIKK